MKTKCKNQYASQTLLLANFEVAVVVDVDGHLSLFVKSTDGSKLVEITDDMGNEGEVCIRVSTESIEQNSHQQEVKLIVVKGSVEEPPATSNDLTGMSKIDILRLFGYDVSACGHQFKAVIVENPDAFTLLVDSEIEAITEAYQFLMGEVDPALGYVFPV